MPKTPKKKSRGKFGIYNDVDSPNRSSPSRQDMGYTPDRNATKARIRAQTKKKKKKKPKKKASPKKTPTKTIRY